jgi:hypothetical protein
MRRLAGEEAGCVFCGEDEANIASVPQEEGGYQRDWLVCLSCGTSNARRYLP